MVSTGSPIFGIPCLTNVDLLPFGVLEERTDAEHPDLRVPHLAPGLRARSQANSMRRGRLLETGSYNTVSFKLVSELRGVTVTN